MKLTFTSRQMDRMPSPSLRGSGLKYRHLHSYLNPATVSLFTREWIEILADGSRLIEQLVSLFTREWIEITIANNLEEALIRLPLYEGVD